MAAKSGSHNSFTNLILDRIWQDQIFHDGPCLMFGQCTFRGFANSKKLYVKSLWQKEMELNFALGCQIPVKSPVASIKMIRLRYVMKQM